MRRVALLALFALPVCAAAGFTPTSTPELAGVRATVDLPVSQHMRNTGGSDGPRGPGSGSGLCVFTSVEHAARWQNVADLDGFQAWMTRRPGGGWPRKLDQMLAAYCGERGVPVPAYVQHTGGDEAVIELALKTDRLPCVTYAGRDDYYGGRIAHMVNVAHMDDKAAAVIDNNRPGKWVWMTRREFLDRWRDMDGGWVVVLLNSPPPPHPERAQAVCVCGADCECAAKGRECPGGCPVARGQVADWKWEKVCGPDGCRLVKIPAGGANNAPAGRPVGNPPGPDFVWHHLPGVGWGWVQRSLVPAAPTPEQAPAPLDLSSRARRNQEAVGELENYGVVREKVHDGATYSINGTEVTRPAALAAIAGGALSDDSDRWHLTAVGDAAFLSRVKADVAALPDAVRAKLHVQCYAADHWAVGLYDLPPGVSLRRPSPARTASQAGVVAADGYSREKLAAMLLPVSGGKPPQPMPAPGPDLHPVPIPFPAPTPSPAPPADRTAIFAAVVAAIVALFAVLRRRN